MPQTWRVSPLGRVGGLLPVLPWGLVLLLTRGSTLALLGAGLFALGWVLFALRPRLILTDTEVVVRNPTATYRIALKDVVSAKAGYGGVAITTQDGSRIGAWAVQKSNWATWSGRRTRADEVADAIMAARVRKRRARRFS